MISTNILCYYDSSWIVIKYNLAKKSLNFCFKVCKEIYCAETASIKFLTEMLIDTANKKVYYRKIWLSKQILFSECTFNDKCLLIDLFNPRNFKNTLFVRNANNSTISYFEWFVILWRFYTDLNVLIISVSLMQNCRYKCCFFAEIS